MKINITKPIAFFDLETTGTNVASDRIVEISIVRIETNFERTIYTQRINPGIPISKESTKIHGITNDDVKDCPTFKQASPKIIKLLEGADLSGFNVLKFDVPLLIEECLRNGVNFSIEKRRILDSQKIFHLMEKRNLTAAYKFYCNKDLVKAHSSEADTLATVDIFMEQIKKYDGHPITNLQGETLGVFKNDMDFIHGLGTNNMVDMAGRVVLNEKKVPVFNFGKYKGKAVREVFEKDPSYYTWIMSSSFSQDTKNKLTKIKLQAIEN